MKKKIGIGLAVAAAALAAVSPAQAHHGDGPKPKKCWNDAYGAVGKLQAPKGTTCGTAYNVLDRWMNATGLDGTHYLRVGRDGVLWRCYGSRAYGKLNPWYVSCSSSQKQWHYNRKYDYSWYSTKSMSFEYRD